MANFELGRQFCAFEQILSQVQATQAEILGRPDLVEVAQARSSDQHERHVTQSNHMVNALDTKLTGLNPQEHILAKDRAFAVTEVLENIFVQLPMPDLLLAQRVNRCFATVIQSSPKLQRALFFLPEPVGGKPRLNPLMSDVRFFGKLKPFCKRRGTNERTFVYPPSVPSMTAEGIMRVTSRNARLMRTTEPLDLTSTRICRQDDGSYEVLLTCKVSWWRPPR